MKAKYRRRIRSFFYRAVNFFRWSIDIIDIAKIALILLIAHLLLLFFRPIPVEVMRIHRGLSIYGDIGADIRGSVSADVTIDRY